MYRNRRANPLRVAPLAVADLEVDGLDRRIRLGTREIKLSPAEHTILYTLVASVGVVVTYRELANALRPRDAEIRTNAIARHVTTLRKKLKDDAEHPRYLETVVGVGYGIRASPGIPLTRVPVGPGHATRLPTSDDP